MVKKKDSLLSLTILIDFFQIADPTSTPHRPYIDPTSTPHRPHIDPIPEKITIVIQYRLKKRCTANCQDHREMNPLLNQIYISI